MQCGKLVVNKYRGSYYVLYLCIAEGGAELFSEMGEEECPPQELRNIFRSPGMPAARLSLHVASCSICHTTERERFLIKRIFLLPSTDDIRPVLKEGLLVLCAAAPGVVSRRLLALSCWQAETDLACLAAASLEDLCAAGVS
jgi:hypothetical protein